MIFNAQIVESYFGYWPEFTDGKVSSFAYEAPGLVVMCISYFDAERNKGAKVQLRFSGVSDIDFSQLKSENVIDSLCITPGKPSHLTLEACYGLDGSFNFEQAAVVALLPHG